MLRVMSSSNKIDVDNFHAFNLKTYVDLLKLFPWMDIQDSLHGAFHSAQLIKEYNNLTYWSIKDINKIKSIGDHSYTYLVSTKKGVSEY